MTDFNLLPDAIHLDAFVPKVKRPDLLNMAEELLQKYKRDIMNSLPSNKRNPFTNSRFYSAGMYVLPFLTESIDTRNLRALEVGSGAGIYSSMLSHAFAEYIGVEIEKDLVTEADSLCKKFSCSNVQFFHDEAANLDCFLAKQQHPFDIIILHAVLEHLLPAERLSILQCCWEHLGDNGLLFIGEVPSSIFPEDRHSSFLLYFQQMQIDLWPYFYEESRAEHWKSKIAHAISASSLPTCAYRQGVPIGYREIEKGLGLSSIDALRDHTVADNYDVFLMNKQQGYSRFDFLKLCEIRQFQQYHGRTDVTYPNLPDVFSRHYLDILLSKSKREKIPSDWVAVNLSAPSANTSEMLIEGRQIEPGAKIMVALAASLNTDSAAPIDIMIQILNPGDGGELRFVDNNGFCFFECNIWKTMRKFSRWAGKMVLRLPSVFANDFPIIISAVRKPISVSYIFLRTGIHE